MRALSVACVLVMAAACASSGTPAPEYAIKEDAPPTGSNIRRNAVEGARIPINRKYAELTAEEKGYVHSMYESIAPGDEPPFPQRG